jgi:hypothetical protein
MNSQDRIADELHKVHLALDEVIGAVDDMREILSIMVKLMDKPVDSEFPTWIRQVTEKVDRIDLGVQRLVNRTH